MIVQQNLFGESFIPTPETESIKYAGSKLKLLPYILELAKETNAKTIFDGFAGSTRVSQAFAKAGYRVISNDISEYSMVIGTCYLKNKKQKNEYASLIEYLNSMPPKNGWFTEHYGGTVGEKGMESKKPWQKKNTRKLDSIREEIDKLKLDEVTKSVALTSLILAMDNVDSTLGHFSSYLKDWSPRSYKDMQMKIPNVWKNEKQNSVLKNDIFKTVREIDTDLAYYDPPYGSNNEKMPPSRVRYASYYHIWTTICKNDKPKLFGKVARREDSSDIISASVFEEFRKNENGKFIVIEAIDKLLSETKCPWIILSYSSGGRATAQELNNVIHSHGKLIKVVDINYKKNVMAGMSWTNEWISSVQEPHREFLFLIKK
ncbi:MAG: DNA adenine methylase [Candidatus Fibromonas sp.]|jgi:adenine-specific DNA-methyltransferase|nr:DNA adenine methylase [Candidatus Fibromonas sp.]